LFNWNRHAITGEDGSDGSGFDAYDNLVLWDGGYHRWWPWPVGWEYIHQFDMHGQDNCGPRVSDNVYNCGRAGDIMHLGYNTFLYTKHTAIKLRGTPCHHRGCTPS
jgi:hypothetical protein